MQEKDMSRQRLDYSEGPSGECIATLTVTLGDGSVHRYVTSVTDEEVEKLAAGYAAYELKNIGEERAIAGLDPMTQEEIAGFFGKIFKAVKSVAKVARKIAASKVFKMAAAGIAAAAPALGPFAPIALAVSGGMAVASYAADASIAAEAGAKKVARTLGIKTGKLAKKLSPKGWRKLLRMGNKKRKSAMKLASRSRKKRRRPVSAKARRIAKRKARRTRKLRATARAVAKRLRLRRRRKPTRRAVSRPSGGMKSYGSKPNILKIAKGGRLRSNRKGAITANVLKKAAKKGRVFWLA